MSGKDAELRRKAEDQLAKQGERKPLPEDAEKILHELLVHQVELEMQNEELRRLQVELEASRARYFDLFDLAPVGYLVLGDKGTILEANLTAADQMGFSRDKLMKAPIMRFIHKQEQDVFYLMRKKLLESNSSQSCQLRVTKADGSFFWANLEASVVRVPDGPPMMRVSISDIHDMVTTRERLSFKEQEYRLLAQNAADVVLRCSPAGVIEWITPSIARVAAWQPQDVVGRDFKDLVNPDDRARVASSQAALRQGVGFESELRIRLKSGGWRWFSVAMRPALDDSGTVTHLVGGWRDISGEVQVREALASEKSRLRAAFDSLLDPLVVLEPMRAPGGGIADFLFADANKAACAYYQLARTDFVGRRLSAVFLPHAAEGMMEICRRAMESEQPLVLDDGAYPHGTTGDERRCVIRGTRIGGSLNLTWRDAAGSAGTGPEAGSLVGGNGVRRARRRTGPRKAGPRKT